MSEPARPRVSELLAQIAALTDVRDLVLAAKAATNRLTLVHARSMRARVDDIRARVEIVDLNAELDGLTGTIVKEKRQPRRGETHMVIIELDEPSAATLAKRSAKWKQALDTLAVAR